MNTRELAGGGMMASAIVALLLISVPFPSLSLTCAGIAGLCVLFTLVRWNVRTATLCYITASVLSLLLLPRRDAAFEFMLLFGPYACVQELLFSRIKGTLLVWVCKAIYFNSLLAILIGSYRFLFAMPVVVVKELYFIVPLANVAFILWDIAFTKFLLHARKRYRSIG